MEPPKIISVDDHVVEPPHVWQTWLPEKYRERGPRGRDEALGRLQAPQGREVPDGGGSRRQVGERLVLRGRAHLRPQAVRRDPAGGDDRRGREHRVRPRPDDDDRAHVRRDASRLLRPRRARRRTSPSTGPTARCRSRRSRASADRRSTKERTRSSVSRASGRTTTGWSRSGASRPAASTSRSASSRCGTSSSRRRRRCATRSAACTRSASARCRTAWTCRRSTPGTGTRCGRSATTTR